MANKRLALAHATNAAQALGGTHGRRVTNLINRLDARLDCATLAALEGLCDALKEANFARPRIKRTDASEEE